MNLKALTFTCAVSMAMTFVTGCGGTNDSNGDGVEHFSSNNASGITRKRGVEPARPSETLDVSDNRPGSNGDAGDTDRIMSGYTTGTGTNGTTTGQGTDNTGALGGPTGTLGLANLLADRDTLIIGNMVIVARDPRIGGGVSRFSLDFGPNVTIFEVTDPKAIEAIDRVKTKLNRNSERNGVAEITSDIQYILQQAKRMTGGTSQAGTGAGTNNGNR